MNRSVGAFPFAPLGAILERHLPEIATGGGAYLPVGDLARAADLLNVSERVLRRWKSGQALTARTADRCAIRLGLHPALIWWDYNDVCDELERDAAERRAATIARARAVVRTRRHAEAA